MGKGGCGEELEGNRNGEREWENEMEKEMERYGENDDTTSAKERRRVKVERRKRSGYVVLFKRRRKMFVDIHNYNLKIVVRNKMENYYTNIFQRGKNVKHFVVCYK